MAPKKTRQQPEHAGSITLEMECVSKPKQVHKVEDFLKKVSKATRLDDGTFYRLLVASTEAVNNGIVHGNKNNPRKKVCITCVVNSDSIIVKVRDEGKGFDPSIIPNPLDDNNLLKETGRGIFLIRSMMDTVDFEVTAHGTTVVMVIDMRRLR